MPHSTAGLLMNRGSLRNKVVSLVEKDSFSKAWWLTPKPWVKLSATFAGHRQLAAKVLVLGTTSSPHFELVLTKPYCLILCCHERPGLFIIELCVSLTSDSCHLPQILILVQLTLA